MQQKGMDEQTNENKPLLSPTLPKWWRVIPALLIGMITSNIDNLILNDFIEYRYRTYYQVNSSSTPNTRELCLNASKIVKNASDHLSTTTSLYPITTTMSPTDLVQASTARLNVYISLAATIPAILTAILLGANCDRIGRKPLIVLPFIGRIIRYCILIAVSYYNLSDLWIVLAVLFDSIFGTGALIILSSFAYVTDCTTEQTRTAAIIITDVFMASSKFPGLLTIGIYLQHPHFIQAMLFTLLLSFIGFVYSIVLQPESNLNTQHLNFFQQLAQIKLKETTKIFRVFFVRRTGHKQRSLLMLVSTHLCMITMSCGNVAIIYLYLYGAPFCFDSFGVSLVTVSQSTTMILLTIICTLTIIRRTDHLILPSLGCLSFMTQLVLFGLSNQVWMIYLAVCLGGGYNALAPVVRSRITKLVEPSEYAVVFILAMIFESGGYYAITAMVNEIYRVSLTFYSGLVFFVLAMFGGLAIILMFMLYMLEYGSRSTETAATINE